MVSIWRGGATERCEPCPKGRGEWSGVCPDEAVVALDSMLAAYYEGRQIALHRISYQRKDMVVNPQHYRRLTLKQTMDTDNVLLEQGKVIDFPLKPSDLSRYDEVLYD